MLKATFVLFKKIIISLVLLCLCGCSVNKSTFSMLTKSHKQCLNQEKIGLSKAFDAYRIAKNNNNISQTIDSVIMSLTNKNDKDTIYIVEDCNPPLYSYNAIIWSRGNAVTLFGSGVILGGIGDEDKELISIVEKWDRLSILQKSHEQPLSYSGEWVETRIASRIIMGEGKCLRVETICFPAIDMYNASTPTIGE